MFGVTFAQESTPPPTPPPAASAEEVEWDILQLGFWFGNPKYQDVIGASGFRIGAPFCGGKAPVYGVEGALLGAGSNEVNGVQFGLFFAKADTINGLQAGFYTDTREVNGVQVGIVNFAKAKSFQIGLVNFIEDGVLPWCILFNFKF
jgi:hypothetical protein